MSNKISNDTQNFIPAENDFMELFFTLNSFGENLVSPDGILKKIVVLSNRLYKVPEVQRMHKDDKEFFRDYSDAQLLHEIIEGLTFHNDKVNQTLLKLKELNLNKD